MAVIPRTLLVTVTTAGTRVPLVGPSVALPNSIIGCVIQCKTGTIYVGDVNVTAANGIAIAATGNAILNLPMQAGKDAIDLRQVYIDGATSLDKAAVLYFEKTS